jgi:hypothetical protein
VIQTSESPTESGELSAAGDGEKASDGNGSASNFAKRLQMSATDIIPKGCFLSSQTKSRCSLVLASLRLPQTIFHQSLNIHSTFTQHSLHIDSTSTHRLIIHLSLKSHSAITQQSLNIHSIYSFNIHHARRSRPACTRKKHSFISH